MIGVLTQKKPFNGSWPLMPFTHWKGAAFSRAHTRADLHDVARGSSSVRCRSAAKSICRWVRSSHCRCSSWGMHMLRGCPWSRQSWALAVCALIGFAIGPSTTGLSVPSFVTTLGMLSPNFRADLGHLDAQFTEDHPGIGHCDAVADLDDNKAGKRADRRHRCGSPDRGAPSWHSCRSRSKRSATAAFRSRAHVARRRFRGAGFRSLLRGRSLCSPGREFVWSDGAVIA
jgi:hypothetical protein